MVATSDLGKIVAQERDATVARSRARHQRHKLRAAEAKTEAFGACRQSLELLVRSSGQSADCETVAVHACAWFGASRHGGGGIAT